MAFFLVGFAWNRLMGLGSISLAAASDTRLTIHRPLLMYVAVAGIGGTRPEPAHACAAGWNSEVSGDGRGASPGKDRPGSGQQRPIQPRYRTQKSNGSTTRHLPFPLRNAMDPCHRAPDTWLKIVQAQFPQPLITGVTDCLMGSYLNPMLLAFS